MSTLRRTGVCLVVLAISVAPLVAAPAKQAARAVDVPSGLVVAVDPATGALRQPTAEEVRRLTMGMASLLGPSRKLTAQTLSDGTELTELDASYQHFLLTSVDLSGEMTLQCVQAEDNGPASILRLRPVAPAAERE